ncbi:MAG: DUF3795 domain-containing protein [Spirochaetaceae bacterium]|nr:MAG: DUF3795 domain-containing protein [Spirochaetaceae bacterium]
MTNQNKIIAKCGLDCVKCGAYQATIHNSDELRKKTADEWSKMFGGVIDWKTINCLGCQQNDKAKLFSHCMVCGVRTCALEKGYATCAECKDFGCEKVSAIWKYDENAKKSLEALRSRPKSTI